MTTRRHIPVHIQSNVIHNSAGRCVICYGLRQFTDPRYPHVQIAHIDKNNENNAEDNLALLCMPCHNMYDSTLKQGKNYTTQNIKRWRNELYDDVKNDRLLAPMLPISNLQYNAMPNKRFSDETISTLRNFIANAAHITTVLCNKGTYLVKCIDNNYLDFIEEKFSYWHSNILRCRNHEITPLQDEFVSILTEISDSYYHMASLNDSPQHIFPSSYY
ncbi:HNH endonuclease family protein, partial [Yersinia mollaretii]|uniref:hypothetical protein n=1 Tax=Yersinia mollaretii TaxID=33060 RepID=UPI001C93DFED